MASRQCGHKCADSTLICPGRVLHRMGKCNLQCLSVLCFSVGTSTVSLNPLSDLIGGCEWEASPHLPPLLPPSPPPLRPPTRRPIKKHQQSEARLRPSSGKPRLTLTTPVRQPSLSYVKKNTSRDFDDYYKLWMHHLTLIPRPSKIYINP